MAGPTLMRGAAVLIATALVLAGFDSAGAQPRRDRAAQATPQAQTKPLGDGVEPGELARLFDAYTVMQAQEVLGLDEARFATFVTRLRALQELRRRHLRERRVLMRQLRQLVASPGDEVQLRAHLEALTRLESTILVDEAKARDAIDELLDLRQRARFRLLEQQLELRKLELVGRARQRLRRERP